MVSFFEEHGSLAHGVITQGGSLILDPVQNPRLFEYYLSISKKTTMH